MAAIKPLTDYEIDALLQAIGLGRPLMDAGRPDILAALSRGTKALSEAKTRNAVERQAREAGRASRASTKADDDA